MQGVLARQATLPCDITPLERDDAVYMVLWFRDGDGEPLFRFVNIMCNKSRDGIIDEYSVILLICFEWLLALLELLVLRIFFFAALEENIC